MLFFCINNTVNIFTYVCGKSIEFEFMYIKLQQKIEFFKEMIHYSD